MNLETKADVEKLRVQLESELMMAMTGRSVDAIFVINRALVICDHLCGALETIGELEERLGSETFRAW